MNENNEKDISIEPENLSTEETNTIDNSSLNLEELIARVNLLANNDNPYSASKEIEEIKSLFYSKLKAEIKNSEKEKGEEIEEETKLHPLEIEFKKSYNQYKKVKFEYRKKKEAEEEKNLKTKLQIIKDIDKLTQEDESIKKTFEHFRILQEQWKNTGHVPIIENNNIWQSYHHHVELFYDYIKINNDLRDLDFKRNLEEKTKICEKAEALLNEKSHNTAHHILQELHEHWKNVGPVQKELREDLWERFQTITRTLNKRRNDYFLNKKAEDANKLEKKNEICKKIEALTEEKNLSHNKWAQLTEKCAELEKEWKSLGKLNKTDNKTAWNNLRASLNIFYNKKNLFYKERKEDAKSVLATKTNIAEKAEALQNSTDWQETGKTLIKLQEEWKNSGFAPAKQSNEIWKRFRTACDTFFNARKAHYKELDKEKEVALKDKTELLKKLKSFSTSENSKEDVKQLKELNKQWKAIGHIPKNKMKINDEFFSLLNAKFEELGLSKKALATEQYKNKISSLQGNSKAIESEQRFLRNKIDSLFKDIAQYENNMSFFGNNKSTEPLKKQVEVQIKKANKEIEELKKKLQLLKKV